MLAALLVAMVLPQTDDGPVRPVPLTPPGTWVSSSDIRGLTGADSINGHTVAELTVDADGRVTACAIKRPSGLPTLDALVCRKASDRARFRPVRDAGGAAVAGSYLLPIRWGSPAIGIAPSASRRVIALEKGKAVSCADYAGDGSVLQAPTMNGCFANSRMLRTFFGDDYMRADQLTISTWTLAGDGPVPRPATDGKRVIVTEIVATVGDDGRAQSCRPRISVEKQSLEECFPYELDGRKFTGLKSFVFAIDWTLGFPSADSVGAAKR